MQNKIKNYKNKGFTRTLNFSKGRSLVCGFTLIELMVAISIFMMIMIMAMGSVLVASDVSKKADKLRTAMDNVNFAMESMTRSIRMGTAYGPGSKGNNESFSFTDSAGVLTEYYKDNDTLKRKKGVPGFSFPLISGEVKVDTLKFFVRGTALGDTIQPSVYIIMKGTVNVKGTPYSFALQTMASQRNLELVP